MSGKGKMWTPLLVALALWSLTSQSRADDCSCTPTHHCPPHYCHVYERPPCVIFKCGCPKPVCNPCDLPHAGYFPPCWRSWPYPPDWTHCPYPPSGALIAPPSLAELSPRGAVPPAPGPDGRPEPTLPAPRREGAKPSVRVLD
jgi:hypothetical protein